MDEIEERVEEEEAAVYQRLYTVRQRQDAVEFYNDEEFFQRFRLPRRTVAYVATLIDDQIRPNSDRNTGPEFKHSATPVVLLFAS